MERLGILAEADTAAALDELRVGMRGTFSMKRAKATLADLRVPAESRIRSCAA